MESNQNHPVVFISHSDYEKEVASAMCKWLEKENIGCWLAKREIILGTDYKGVIMDAITSCKIMIVIFSANANESPNVLTEVDTAFQEKKKIIPVRLDHVKPSNDFKYCFRSSQWLDATDPQWKTISER